MKNAFKKLLPKAIMVADPSNLMNNFMINFPISRSMPGLLVALLLALGSCSTGGSSEPGSTERVLVTIAPYKVFAERIVGDTVEVETLVPPTANMHFFEPTARQMLEASEVDLWFRTGEPFETKVVAMLQERKPHMRIVDIGTPLLDQDGHPHEHHHHEDHKHSHDHHAHSHDGHDHSHDLHFWLSPRRVIKQVQLMTEQLSEQYPEHAAEYEERLDELLDDLRTLDLRLATILDCAKAHVILVSHPAYTYFCEDYGLEQVSLEQEGRDPTPQTLTTLVQWAREKQIKRIFVQPQHSDKGAILVADAIGAEVVEIDPYAPDYFENMRSIAWRFAGY